MGIARKIGSIAGRGLLSVALAGSMTAFGAVAAFADDDSSAADCYWSTPSDIAEIDEDALTTYGVRAGSAGGDFLGISNTNFDFNKGTNSTGVTGFDSITDMGADYLTTVYGSGLAIWATSLNENANPYYANLYYTIVTGEYTTAGAAALGAATTWMSNPEESAWGDSDNSTSYDAEGNETISGLEYEPDIIWGANKTTNWNLSSDGSNSETNIYAYESEDEDYNPVYVNNDSTNLWTQIYTMGQLATAADELEGTTRYDDSSATTSAVAYEKATKGQLLYIASLIDSGELEAKTIAYLYAIDDEGTGYFFVPTAEGLLSDSDTGYYEAGKSTTADTEKTTYGANNSTINMGYMATLPFVSTTFDSGDELEGGIVMRVEDIYSSNPVCTVGTSSASDVMADVDVIIYNSSTASSLAGTSGGKNSSGVEKAYTLTAENVTAWAASYGFTGSQVIAGDDYGTSTNQGVGDSTYTTEDGTAPLLYCQRNYTTDKDTRAAWGFAAVYPEAYEGNNDATYAYWVNNIYHVTTDNVASVVTYMTNQSDEVVYDEDVEAFVEEAAAAGYEWWIETGSADEDWSGYAYYNGSSRASYYGGDTDAEEPVDTIGIFAPSSLWTAEVESATTFTFTDVDESAYYYTAVYYLNELGIITGYTSSYATDEDGNTTATFGSSDTIKRCDVAVILWRMACPDEYAAYADDADNESGLSDVADDTYYTAAVNWAVEQGIITGYTSGKYAGKFRPSASITFQELCAMVARYVTGETDVTAADADATLAAFNDGDDVSSWAEEAVAYCVEQGIVNGTDDGDLAPTSKISRSRTAQLLYQAIEAGAIAVS